MRRLGLLVLLLFNPIFARAQSKSQPQCARGAVCFSGDVTDGQEFRRSINADLDFVLTGGGGIAVVPRRPDGKDCVEFARVVTPPQRAHNPLEIDAAYDWSAEQEVETSPREFNFVTSCEEYRNASALLQTVLWPKSAKTFDDAFARLDALPTGKGRVWITDSKVTHPRGNVVTGNGAIEWMKFSVEIRIARPKTKP